MVGTFLFRPFALDLIYVAVEEGEVIFCFRGDLERTGTGYADEAMAEQLLWMVQQLYPSGDEAALYDAHK